MNLELKQLSLLLREYEKTLKAIEGTYDNVEYLAWLSMLSKEQWPKEATHTFHTARSDPKFRVFRDVYKAVGAALGDFKWGTLPFDTRTGYQQRYLKENPDGVPF